LDKVPAGNIILLKYYMADEFLQSFHIFTRLDWFFDGLDQSTEGAEFVWVSECQKREGCEIINQFVFV
jgi:hypothetical protein